MGLKALIIVLIVGAIAGFLAGQIMKGRGFGLLGNIVVGVVGAVFARWLFGFLGFAFGGGIIGAIIHATIGAVLLLALIRVIRRL